ncbi:MAG: BMP family ABC transporter substrate-binding protein [Mycoplasma sp.]
MLVKAGLWKIIGIVSGVIAIPGVVIGGYYIVGAADKYRGFYNNPQNDGLSGFLSAYRGAVLQGAEVVMTPGFNHATPIEAAFQESGDFYKNTGFMLFDGTVTGNTKAAANTWAINYRSDLGSIQVGIAAAYFLNYYQDFFANEDKTDLTYGLWGGMPYSSVISFMGGFDFGIKWANDNFVGKEINGNTYKEVKKIQGELLEDLTGGFGPSDGIAIQQRIVAARPDILMPVAGPQVWTAADLISKLPNSKTILIGVDSPVEDDSRNTDYPFTTSSGDKIGNGKRVQFSSLKDLSLSAETALNIINNGNKIPKGQETNDRYDEFFDGKNTDISGFGTVAIGNTKNGCVGISESGNKWYKDALKTAGKEDPTNEEQYSLDENMVYTGYNGAEFSYGGGPWGLQKSFSIANDKEVSGFTNLDKTGFVKYGVDSDKTKFKIILSSVGSILMDSSFSQSCYYGLHKYLKTMGIDIPAPTGGK